MKLEITAIVTIILVYISGSIFFIEYLYPISYIVVLVAFFILNLLKMSWKIRYIDAICISLLIILNLITFLISNDRDITSYLGFITSLFIAYFALRLVTISEFVTSYSNIITFLSFASIIFFALGIINPEFIVDNLTFIKGIQDVDYYNAFVHVYQYSEKASLMFNHIYIEPRNASIFWEPGVFQAFININIYFILRNILYNSRQRIVFLIINVVALTSTYSIAGFFIFILILVEYFYTQIKNEKYKKNTNALIILLFVVIVLIIFALGGLDIIITRITYYGDNIIDFLNAVVTRMYFHNLIVFKDKIHFLFFGFGYSFPRNQNANSIVEMIITNGLVFSSTLLIYLWYNLKRYFKSSTLFVILLIIFLSEPLLQKPFFLFFIFLREEF